MVRMDHYRRTSHTKFDIKLHFVWIISSSGEGEERSGVSEEFEQSSEKVNRRFAKVFKRLAE